MRWFRFYAEALRDPKVQQLPAPLFKFWVNILCMAHENDGIIPDIKTVAFDTRMRTDRCQLHVTALTVRGLLDDTPDGLMPHNWRGRQYKSDDSAVRMQRHRAEQVTPPENRVQKQSTEGSVLPSDPADHPVERQPSPALAIREFERSDAKHASTQLVALGNAYGLSFSGKGGHLKKIIDRYKNRHHIVRAVQATAERLAKGGMGDQVEHLEGVLRNEETNRGRPSRERNEEERPGGQLEGSRIFSRSEIAAADKAEADAVHGAGPGDEA